MQSQYDADKLLISDLLQEGSVENTVGLTNEWRLHSLKLTCHSESHAGSLSSGCQRHAPLAAGDRCQHLQKAGPKACIHVAVDDGVVARMGHGQPVQHQP